MKKYFFIAFIFMSSLSSQASEFVACRDLKSVEYNAVFEFINNRIVNYSTLELDFKTYIQVKESENLLSFIFVSEYDTNFGYDVSLINSNSQNISLAAWTSGNDSDNYNGVVRNVTTECHLLKSKPENSVFDIKNYSKTILVN